MGDPIAAIVTNPWSSITVNLKLIPDHGPMQDRGSVSHKSAMPGGGGYYWLFPEEYYGVKGGEEIPAGSFKKDEVTNLRRIT
ncbi:hypothetical protein, partial [Enterobacter hormaechei]|uniref:hypothetical protein n=1 Tax=Enterobacter hormaechei TaxID=158836 RepID=UPI002E2E43A1